MDTLKGFGGKWELPLGLRFRKLFFPILDWPKLVLRRKLHSFGFLGWVVFFPWRVWIGLDFRILGKFGLEERGLFPVFGLPLLGGLRLGRPRGWGQPLG